MAEYEAEFPVGTLVRIASVDVLSRFERPQWEFHHPVSTEQIAFAGTTAIVTEIGYYHGGGALYQLEGVPGTWHEAVLSQAGSADV